MSIDALYRESVLDHNRRPRRFGPLEAASHAGRGARPSCGDDLCVRLRVDEGRIAAYAFEGEGCAVAVAAASMLGEVLDGAPAGEAASLRAAFEAMLRGAAPAPCLHGLSALAGLAAHPARHGCALLAFDAVDAALASPEPPR
jgi:nitrogen fixation NifU-like protein